MSDDLLLYQNSEPDVYNLVQIFDPDQDLADSLNQGKIVPAVGSIVVFPNQQGLGRVIKIVDSVDDTTKKVTYVDPEVLDDGLGPDKLVNYGNDTMILFYDPKTSPTRLLIDSKFIIIGSNAAEYRIYAVDSQGKRESISLYINSAGQHQGDRVPIVNSAQPGIKEFSDCHTLKDMTAYDYAELEIYNSAGTQTTLVRLVVKKATVLNDFLSSGNPITSFTATTNQQLPNGDWIIYRGQQGDDFNIFPVLGYADSNTQLLGVDNQSTFAYGVDDIDSSVIGAKFNIMVKHFLANNISSTIAEGDGVRFVKFEKEITVVEEEFSNISKISVLPKYNNATSEYDLTYFAYLEDRDSLIVIDNLNVVLQGAYNGRLYGVKQDLRIDYSRTKQDGSVETFSQEFTIQLNGPSDSVPWTIAEDNNTTVVYGTDNALHSRPRIKFDSARGTYFIPTSSFVDDTEFIDNFYRRLAPPYRSETESLAPEPTHFVIRDLFGRILTTTPIAVGAYAAEFALITTGQASQHNNSTVVVEFLLESGGQYMTLFGGAVETSDGVYNS